MPLAAPATASSRSTALLLLCGLWIAVFASALFTPPLLDDADATHANAARHILESGDWVTLHVNGIRYLEKAPLPYWLVAVSFRLFGINTCAAHLPGAIAVLLLALLGYRWGAKAFDDRTALYTGIAVLTSAGVFLFTRIFIPEVLLSLFLCTTLYCFLQTLEPHGTEPAPAPAAPIADAAPRALYPYAMWTALALAVLSKGLVAPVFFFGTALVYLALTGDYRRWRSLKPLRGALLLLAIAAPWHIVAGLRNTGGQNGHGFFWFYFINEHFLRFLGRRIPMDYNKLPGYLFWSLHLAWLFPWSLFVPVGLVSISKLWQKRRSYPQGVEPVANESSESSQRWSGASFAARSVLLLGLYSALVLVFFSLSTNQEYYTFPAYLPLLLLLAAALTRAEAAYANDRSARRAITVAHAAFTVAGLAIAVALFLGLWSSRHMAFVPDIGSLLAHRGVGDYTLSMSHLFDLTGPSFAALRLPAALAALAFVLGPAIAWSLRRAQRHLAATATIALTSAVFLIAAHIAFARFAPMLSSEDFAATIQQLQRDHAISADTRILLYGDQAYGSSIPFYLGQQVLLVEGRSTSMLFGSTFADAPPIFLTDADLVRGWGNGARKLLFVPLERRDAVDHLLGSRQILLKETSGKALITDRPLLPAHSRTP
ncbi:MAG TPA: glycosyltransferase family 39 protein [Granulicella sp.]|nr:glycosyltransferase family 39 protein [Granulicella sp.]